MTERKHSTKAVTERIFGLDIMRAVAIVFVLLSHTILIIPVPGQYMIFQYFGYFGVEIFFVLSGYLVGKILIGLFNTRSIGFNSLSHFWVRRWFRTLPGYYLALILTTGVYYFTNKEFIFSDKHNLLFFVFLQNFFSVHPNFFPQAWSLSIEEWFYLLFPLWILLCYMMIRVKKYQIIAIITFIGLILSLRIIVVALDDPDWDDNIKRIVPLRLDALATGVLAGFIHMNYRDIWNRYAKKFMIIGFLLFIAVSVFFCFKRVNEDMPGMFFWKTFYFNIVSFSITCMVPFLTTYRFHFPLFIKKAITHISLVSYSLYLTHLLIMFVVITLIKKIDLNGLFALRFISCWIFSILGATIFYRLYELPMTNLRDRLKKD